MMTAQSQRFSRSYWLRRGLWALIIVVTVAVFLLDQGLKTAPHSGFAPLDASWHASTADFPGFWGRLEGSDPAELLRAHIDHPTRPFEIAVHERTGIRPTPMRWAVWFGRHATISSNDDGWGACARPGILPHAYHAVRRALGYGGDTTGVYPFADFHYGWRDGFLIFSTSPEFVAASLDADRAETVGPAPSSGLRVHWQPAEASPLEVLVQPGGSIRVTASVQGAFQPMEEESRAPLVNWPDDMLLTAGATRAGDLVELSEAAHRWAATLHAGTHATRLLSETWQRWALPSLEPDWDREVAGLVVGIDMSFRASVIPDIAVVAALDGVLAAEGPHPLAPWLDALAPIPYEWDGVDGGCATLLSDALSLCLGGAGSPWLAASSEPLMAGIAGHRIQASDSDTDLIVELSWHRAATILRQGIVLAARNEAIPGHDTHSLDDIWGNWLDVLGRMGTMRLTGRALDNEMLLEGTLTSVEVAR